MFVGLLHIRFYRGVPRLADRRECVGGEYRVEIPFEAPDVGLGDDDIG